MIEWYRRVAETEKDPIVAAQYRDAVKRLMELRAKQLRRRIYNEKPHVPTVLTRAVLRKRQGSRMSPETLMRSVTETATKRWAFVFSSTRRWWRSPGMYVRRRIRLEPEETEQRELKPRPPTPKRNARAYHRGRARTEERELIRESIGA